MAARCNGVSPRPYVAPEQAGGNSGIRPLIRIDAERNKKLDDLKPRGRRRLPTETN
jgi:hypothetical protein